MHLRALPLLLALIATPLYAAHPVLEQRAPIRLTAQEKSHIHLEMRLFLSATQKIVIGAAANDMKMLAQAAREGGMAAAHEVPAGLRAKLPLAFKQLGHATHQGFDDLARDAESLGDANHALQQLGEVMSHCVSCHALYRIETRH
ncbi:MAG: hypothetical protein COW48_07020 [Hydrogenophilales bacterium CG17_big_fil_post_rev_8_21_14_2_50_63_12]|nr:MAG: hypothetical protein COW48_07020 [Hydrogenophilales bacterium CG17_big_fil_post_rev_8_21_14_2_50_63_12]PIX97703.1 MAG: hypothetical protein COZ24_03880 [Hydrogenophilales bacterium CG_4_10_14_3_um_filter_63_21]PJB07718.1 MAG: hypothetical protein CO126_00500 [Hydrogenophilales bacterium CG_4_9_14_3_um_filter_63_34]